MTKKHSIYVIFSALLIIMTANASFAGDSKKKEKPTNLVGVVTVPDGMLIEGVQKSVMKAVIGRRWNIVKKFDDRVIINITQKRYDATLTIVYNTENVKIYSDSWALKRSGERKKKKDPESWIENIKKDIGVFLNREHYL
jgi:hypothetical protein